MTPAEPRWLQRLTGAYPEEQRRVLACCASVFCLLASYYLLKPLRNSQFLKEFPPEALPVIYLAVSTLSFAATKAYSYSYDRLEKARLLTSTFVVLLGCKLLFFVGLSLGGKAVTVAFYMWASVYFMLAMAAIWGCINELFRADQGERCFGFVMSGATLGGIAGSAIATEMAAHGPLLLPVSGVFMVMSLVFILMARRRSIPVPPSPPPLQGDGVDGFWLEVRQLLRKRYLRGIAAMVFGLAIYNTGIDLISQKQMDRRLAELGYRQTFSRLNEELNRTQAPQDRQRLNATGFEFIYRLREVPEWQISEKVQEFARQHQLQPLLASSLATDYQGYRIRLNTARTDFFSQTFLRQGICGLLVLTLLSRWLFATVGIRRAVQIMPVFALMALAVFNYPLELLSIQWLLVAGGTLNYSLNNATKEVLYTVTSTDNKYKVKPVIEGPVMRCGDVVAAVVSLLCQAAVSLWTLPAQARDHLFLAFCFLCVVVWWREVRFTGREYDRLREGTG